ncbi:hypothetical protein [Trichormus azollae]|jgi:hypothetical protein|uniref:Uncharacterized protein n=1 Tax=Nostoc azollae (strain 0708) TaxID=551115 RepID=D7E5C3_NOSA0|nr:hypothetical protein [Trichormus azollae]ADI65483.1 hypothetical protein Aazo_3999 ['Nostoc azollae' 0708]
MIVSKLKNAVKKDFAVDDWRVASRLIWRFQRVSLTLEEIAIALGLSGKFTWCEKNGRREF